MPNHVTTRCTISGDPTDIARFESLHFLPREEVEVATFDFNTIIPRPVILEGITAGGNVDLSLSVLRGEPIPEWRQASVEHLTEADLEMGRQALRAIAECGHKDWYEWSIANWGTKWNSYEFRWVERLPEKLVFRFETAWSFPEPIFQQLVEMYPELIFNTVSYDEYGNWASVGTSAGKTWLHVVENATPELYEAAYGHPMEEEEEVGEEPVEDDSVFS